MSSRLFLKLFVFSLLIHAAGSFGQRTDNCTSRAHKGYTPCGFNKCCCTYEKAICSGFGTALRYIPQLEQHISHVVFVGNYLPVLSEKTFSNISTGNRLELILTNNSIWNISVDAFSHFTHLINLILNGNKLEILYVRPFQSLKQLQFLDLKNNKIRDIVTDGIHPSIHYLRLTNNLLFDEIHQNWFCSSEGNPVFPGLKEIMFADNAITTMTNNSFKCLDSLQILSLDTNIIQDIHPNAFSNLQSLDILELSHMRKNIRKIPNFAFNNSHMKHFIFRENYIKFLPDLAATIFNHSSNIRVLDISHNSLIKLSQNQFLGMLLPLKGLEKLMAGSCQLSTLPASFLSYFRNLSILFLEGNNIKTLDYFRNVYNLKSLSLQGNMFGGVRENEVSHNFMNSLEYLNLGKNPFDCTCALLWFRSMIKDGKFGNISLVEWPYPYSCYTPPNLKYTRLIKYMPTKLSCTNVLEIALISLGVVLVMASVISILSFRYRWYIKYWFYKMKTHYRNPETRPLLCPDSHGYDGYVIYHTEDSQYVHHDLRLFMEEKHEYKLHIWERDAPTGCSNLEGMVDGIQASEHVIAVISQNSIQDRWVEFQMDIALGMQVEFKKRFLILIILEDVDFQTLSKYWCVMLTRLSVARWCRDETDVKQAVFEQQITNHFGGPKLSRF